MYYMLTLARTHYHSVAALQQQTDDVMGEMITKLTVQARRIEFAESRASMLRGFCLYVSTSVYLHSQIHVHTHTQ